MAKEFKIENVTLKTILSDDGRFMDVYEVVFTTAKGIRSKINIEKSNFTPENVQKIVLEEAKKIDAVLNL